MWQSKLVSFLLLLNGISLLTFLNYLVSSFKLVYYMSVTLLTFSLLVWIWLIFTEVGLFMAKLSTLLRCWHSPSSPSWGQQKKWVSKLLTYNLPLNAIHWQKAIDDKAPRYEENSFNLRPERDYFKNLSTFFKIVIPWNGLVNMDSGWNCTAAIGSSVCCIPITIPSSDTAVISKQEGILSRNPWREWYLATSNVSGSVLNMLCTEQNQWIHKIITGH
jgi:hypothetical protein